MVAGILAMKHMVRVNPHLEESEATTAEPSTDKVQRVGEEVIESRGRGEGAEDGGRRGWLCLTGRGGGEKGRRTVGTGAGCVS